MRRSTEARNLLADLESDLAEASAEAGELLEWSPAESELLKLLGSAVDRKCYWQREFDRAETTSSRVSISAEIRLLESHIARLLTQLRKDLPTAQPQLVSTVPLATSIKNRKAAQTHWRRQHAATS